MPDQPEQADVGTTQQFALVNFRARQVPTLVFFFPLEVLSLRKRSPSRSQRVTYIFSAAVIKMCLLLLAAFAVKNLL